MRSRLDEVKSGLRIALITVGGILVVLALGRGLRLIETGSLNQKLAGMTIALFSVVILSLTVAHWAKWFFGACCLFTLRAVVFGLLGRTISTPSIAGSRILFAEFAGIFAIMALLTYRFVDTKPNRVDSVCLVGAVLAILYSLIARDSVPWMLVPVSLLGIAAAYGYAHSRMAKRQAGS